MQIEIDIYYCNDKYIHYFCRGNLKMKKYIALLCIGLCQSQQSSAMQAVYHNVLELTQQETIWKSIAALGVGYILLRELIVPCGRNIVSALKQSNAPSVNIAPTTSGQLTLEDAMQRIRSLEDNMLFVNSSVKTVREEKIPKLTKRYNDFKQKIQLMKGTYPTMESFNSIRTDLFYFNQRNQQELTDLRQRLYHSEEQIMRVINLLYGGNNDISSSQEISPPLTPRTFTSLITSNMGTGKETPRSPSPLTRQISQTGNLQRQLSKKNVNLNTTSAEKKPTSGNYSKSDFNSSTEKQRSSPEDSMEMSGFQHVGDDSSSSSGDSSSDEEIDPKILKDKEKEDEDEKEKEKDTH